MANKEFLKKLLETPSPSGIEELGLKVWEERMKGVGTPFYKDKMGNTAYSIGSGPLKVMFSAHIDEIAMSVGYITDSGFIIPKNMGGVDKKVLPGSAVLILREPNLESIEGVVHKNPIHIEYQEEKLKNKVLDFDDFRIDIGAESKEEVETLGIHVGSPIVHGRIINLDFGSHRVHGNSLDDKAGVFVVSEVMERLAEYTGQVEWKQKYTVIGCACVGEESGLLGAHKAARQINPDISIDLDVLHAADTELYDKTKYGEIKL
jgi:endoglucanase